MRRFFPGAVEIQRDSDAKRDFSVEWIMLGKIRFRHSYRSSAPRFARLGESSRGAGEELNVAVALDQKSGEAAPQRRHPPAPSPVALRTFGVPCAAGEHS